MKLPYLEQWNEERRKIASLYASEIRNELLVLPQMPKDIREHVFHIYPILVEDREAFLAHARKYGIGTLIHYPKPIMMQEAYKEYRDQIGSYPVTQKICKEEVSIPLYPGLTEEECMRVLECLKSYGT